jgi:hypothetical protein
VLIVSPGLAIAGALALAVLLACAISVIVERRREARHGPSAKRLRAVGRNMRTSPSTAAQGGTRPRSSERRRPSRPAL